MPRLAQNKFVQDTQIFYQLFDETLAKNFLKINAVVTNKCVKPGLGKVDKWVAAAFAQQNTPQLPDSS